MKRHIKTKFLVPILLLQFIALAALGYIGYRFSSDMLRNSAEQRFSKAINSVYDQIEAVFQQRISAIENLLRNPTFIKFSAAPHYKSDVDVAVFNFQKGNGLILGEPEVGGLVNYPVGLQANEGNKGILDMGLFPSEEYVGRDGMVRQHVYLGGSNDVDFEGGDTSKLDRSDTEWFKAAIAGNIYVGRPQKCYLQLREYEPIKISTAEVLKEETLITIAMPHRIGNMIVGVLMVTTTPDFIIYGALPRDDLKSLLLILDRDQNVIAEIGDDSLKPEIEEDATASKVQGEIIDEGSLLAMYKSFPASKWSIAMYGKKADIYGGVYRLRTNIIIIMLASVAIMGFLVFAIIRKLLQPILRLTKASERIAGGELGVTIDKSDDDEIGRLTESFNDMSISTKEMHDRLSRINYVRKQLLQIISHELRTPLNSIIGFYELMKEEIKIGKIDNFKEFEDCFDGLGGSIEKYQRLVERLTKTTSVMSGEMRAEGEVDKRCRLVDAAATALAEARRYGNIITNLDDGIFGDIEVTCPDNAIKLLLEEALSNAIKNSPEDQPINLTASLEGENVILKIEDKGCGIPKSYIHEVVEPFFEVEDSVHHSTGRYKRSGGGLGLGLTIIGSIIRRYQGSMRIESKEGRGTALIISLPAKRI